MKNGFRYLIAFTFTFVLISIHGCKKDGLDGDKAILEGKWKWVQTRFYNPYTVPTTSYSYPEPNYWMTIEFFKKGKLNIEFNDFDHYYNENSRRIQFDEFKANTSNNSYNFMISIMRADHFNGISGVVLDRANDTLVIHDLPVADTLNSVSNYFVRE